MALENGGIGSKQPKTVVFSRLNGPLKLKEMRNWQILFDLVGHYRLSKYQNWNDLIKSQNDVGKWEIEIQVAQNCHFQLHEWATFDDRNR